MAPIVALAAAAPQAAAAPSAAAVVATQSVVKVQARQCSGGRDRSATGFVWGSASQVVTSMHVLAGCASFSVHYEGRGATRAATVQRVLRRADLALLAVGEAPAASPLRVAADVPNESDEVYAVGYYLDIPTANRTSLRLGFAGKRLRDIVPLNVRRELEGLGYPDVDLEVINLEGHLLPGMSGAPIVNARGELVAVADGGLEAGLAGASWGIPVRYLPLLAGSTESLGTTAARQVESLFAIDLLSEAGVSIRCGDLVLQRLRTRPFAEIVHSSDDIVGLRQLIAALGVADLDFDVDVYQDLASGATVAAPAGVRLTAQEGACVATLHDGALELHVQGKQIRAAPNQPEIWVMEVQSATLSFESRALPNAPMWLPDPQWSYWQPQARYDGLLVRRKAVGLYAEGNPWLVPPEYAFETLAARGHVAIGILAKNRDNLRLQLCLRGLQSGPCPPASLLADWSRLILTTHLATFPLS